MAELVVDEKALVEGERPIFKASYGKLMMWFFLLSDAFTFSALLITYGTIRFRATTTGYAWADPESVFTHFPGLYEIFHIEVPLAFVGLMTFILILSSVTMVLAVEAGHRNSMKEVRKWVFLTMLGGIAFLSCQAYEWYHFIIGTGDGAVMVQASYLEGRQIQDFNSLLVVELNPVGEGHHPETYTMRDGSTLTDEGIINAIHKNATHNHSGSFIITGSLAQRWQMEGLEANMTVKAYPVRDTEGGLLGLRLTNGILITEAALVQQLMATASPTQGGANLKANEYGPQAFADLFFFVTGFHGTHVFSGVILLLILLINVNKGTYERRGHYEMVEKIGLYWHFVDLVWVFVFTFFYLV